MLFSGNARGVPQVLLVTEFLGDGVSEVNFSVSEVVDKAIGHENERNPHPCGVACIQPQQNERRVAQTITQALAVRTHCVHVSFLDVLHEGVPTDSVDDDKTARKTH